MLAIIYLVLVFILGDSICRRFFSFVSIPHRFAAAFLSGLLISTWWTYLSALLFYATSSPLLWGNLVLFITSIGLIYWLRKRPPNSVLLAHTDRTATEFRKWDWITLGLVFLMASYLMFSTFGMHDGNLMIGTHQSSDFGSTVSIMQSFARGHNFPTEFPHFSGERIRYHFLFYFQAGNLEYLGFSPAFANNILSVLSMVAMLILVMTLGALIFGSRVVGRVGAALFFFHGTLSFYPFIMSLGSVSAVVDKLLTSQDFLVSGFVYRGEAWGVWSQVVYANQRHLASSIGIFLLVLTFIIIRYRAFEASRPVIEPDVVVPYEETAVMSTVASAPDEFSGLASESSSPFDSEVDEQAVLPDDKPESEDLSDVLELPEVDDAAHEPASEAFVAEAPDRTELWAAQAVDETDDIDHVAENDAAPENDAALENEVAPENEAVPESDVALENQPTDREDPFAAPALPEQPDEPEEKKWIEPVKKVSKPRKTPGEWLSEGLEGIRPFIFAGVLLGLMPLWNGAVFVAAFAVIVPLFVLFPLRRQMIGLGIATAIFALPQIYFLRTGGMANPGYSLVHWGYTLGDPSILEVLEYLAFTFGFKLLLIAIALVVGTWFQRKLMVAISALIILTFCFQFSLEALTNHKFLNIWVVLANLFVAFALWYLWNLKIFRTTIPGRVLAVILTILITLSGVIDLFPFHTTSWGETVYGDDALVRWVSENTDPNSVFLSARHTVHPILLAGRRLFYGHPYYAWGAGYDTHARDLVYVRMLESTNPAEVFDLLKEAGISYVAIDDNLRKNNDMVKKLNEPIYQAYFDVVFEDTQNRYGKLVIYKVPAELGPPKPNVELPPEEPRAPVNTSEAVSAFSGGEGNTPGKFVRPRGIAADDKGNFYVADTGNDRVQKFDADGKFVSVIGDPGEREGKMKEPNGIAIDADGTIYVTDAHSHKLLKYNSDGSFAKEYFGPDSGFYGPRDIAIGPNKQVYIIDQGRTRVARFSPQTETFPLTWGSAGSGDAQFKEPTGIAIGDGKVFVADMGNRRIQVFDLEGQFIRQWEIPAWQASATDFPDAVFDEQSKRLYVTGSQTDEILAFDVNGNQLDGFKSDGSKRLDGPSSLAISESNKKRRLLVLNTKGGSVTWFDLEAPKPEATKKEK